MPQHIVDFCEDKARTGDGSFAVAFALLRLASAQEQTAAALRSLGMGDGPTQLGALEGLTMKLSEGVDRVAEAIDGLAPSYATRRKAAIRHSGSSPSRLTPPPNPTHNPRSAK